MLLEIVLGAVGVLGLALYFIVLKNKRDKIDLHGKHVVVTGGSSGIGRDLCIEAFKQGAHVSILARNKVDTNSGNVDSSTVPNRIMSMYSEDRHDSRFYCYRAVTITVAVLNRTVSYQTVS